MAKRLSALLLALLASMPAGAQDTKPQDLISTRAETSQSPAVRARFADVAITLEAPSLAAGRETFTAQEELAAFLSALKARAQHMQVISIGKSQLGRDLPVALFTAEGVVDFAAAARLGRPVLWFVGQQHGNEPAGGEGMLAFAAYLATSEAKPLLSKVSVAILPRANPDGAAAFTRDTAQKLDLNRDHLLHFLPETRALHQAMAMLPPDVVFDHHEFSVVNRWIEKFHAIQAVDAMVLHATNPMVSREISGLAEELYRPAVEAALKQNGLSMFWYYTTSNRASDKVVSMGGNNPGIARNAFGLRGAVSFLIETRGVGVKREGWQRRVATHVIAARAVLEASAAHATRLREAIDAGRKSVGEAADPLVVAAKIPAKPLTIPLIDPETGADKPVEVPFQDSRIIEPTVNRARAAGYFVTAGAEETSERLRRLGISMCRLAAPLEAELDSYQITEMKKPVDRETINPDQAVKVTVVRRKTHLPAGTLYVPMRQAGAGIVAAALEPDTPGSYLGVGIIPAAADMKEAPVFAAPRALAIKSDPVTPADGAVCAR